MKVTIEAPDFEIREFMMKAGYGFHTYPQKYVTEMDVMSKYPLPKDNLSVKKTVKRKKK